MSDLLLRLSERALGTLPTVKPLLRPGREAASLSGNDIASFESVTEQTTGTPQRSSFTAAPPEMSESAPFDGEIQTAPTSRPAPQRPVQPSVRSLQEVMTRIYEDEPRDREPRRTRLPETDTMPLRIHAQRTRADGTDVPQPQPSLPVAQFEHVRAIDAPSRTDSQLRQEALPARREPAAPPRLQGEERRPDVQVNIGRIDLHTAPAPAVTRHAPPSRPAALSLDSYLAARRGERA